MTRELKSFLLAIPLFFSIAAVLPAHPHMWIRGALEPVVGRKGLEAVKVRWDIDELTSSTLILDYDADKNGVLDRREVALLKRNSFDHLAESEYYLVVEIREMLATPSRAEDFSAEIVNGRIIYDFIVPLEIPIRWNDLADTGIFLFDQSYFIDFRPEDIRDVRVSHGNSTAAFIKTQRRSMTMGYGLVDLTGLAVIDLEHE